MSIMNTTPDKFKLTNKTIYNFKVESRPSILPRGAQYWMDNVVNRIKNSHTLNHDHIKTIIESIYDPRMYGSAIITKDDETIVRVDNKFGKGWILTITPKKA